MKYLVTIAMFTFLFATQSNAQVRIGAGTVLGVQIQKKAFTGLNVSAVYVGEGNLDFGAAYTYWLNDQKTMALDLDAYYLMKVAGANDDIYISPFAGLNLRRDSKVGEGVQAEIDPAINLGVSIKKEVGDRLLFLEPKIFLSGYPDVVIKAGFIF